MIRNSILYHRLWYFRRRNTGKVSIILKFILSVTLLVLMLSFANKVLFPPLADISSSKAANIAENTVKSVVHDVFNSSIRYDDLVIIKKDNAGGIVSIETNIAKLNVLSSKVSEGIYNRLEAKRKQSVAIPMGALLGKSIFAGKGPFIYISIYPYGNVKTDYMSEFTEAGINQTRHRIYIKVKTQVGIAGPVDTKKVEISTVVPVAETVIVGDVPGVYMKLDGK
jgi:sporulation protein YunB